MKLNCTFEIKYFRWIVDKYARMMKTAIMLVYRLQNNLGSLRSTCLFRRNNDKKRTLVGIWILSVENSDLLKLITVNQILEGFRPLFYEHYPLWFLIKSCFWSFCMCRNGKNNKIKTLRKSLHRITQRQIERTVFGRWTPCCRNTLRKSDVYLSICFNQEKRLLYKTFPPFSNVCIHPCH